MKSLSAPDPIDYLRLAHRDLWRWEADTITLTNGSTLAFREELVGLIEAIQPNALPPIETLLLFLVASRENWRTEWVRERLQKFFHSIDPEASSSWLNNLDKINALPAHWRKSIRERSLLASVVFDTSSISSGETTTSEILRLLTTGFIPPQPRTWDSGSARERLRKACEAIEHATKDLSTERLQLRMRTGLDSLFKSTSDLNLPLNQKVQALLDDLEMDPVHQAFARLTKDLMAAIHVPRALGDIEDLPMGGFSDLTNRGTPDRLIMSELAHDDLILSTRIALNEALYLRRESPPETPQNSRLLLVDNGLPLWGVPRVFAAAVATAIAATIEEKTELRTFAPAEGGQLTEVAIETREGLVQLLEGLGLHAHPGNHLVRLLNPPPLSEAAESEIFVITHSLAIEDENFQSLLALSTRPIHLISVNREGEFALRLYHQGQERILQHARLRLNALLDSDPTLKLIIPELPKDLPAAFYKHPFPILFPQRVEPRRKFLIPDFGTVKVTQDGRLLLFTDPTKAGLQLADSIPRGRLWHVHDSDPTCARLLHFRKGAFRIIEIRKDLQQVNMIPFTLQSQHHVIQAVMSQEVLLIVFPTLIQAIDPKTGELISTTKTAHLKKGEGPYIRQGSRWFRVSFDGMNAVLEQSKPIQQAPRTVETRPRSPWDSPLGTDLKGIGIHEEQIILTLGGGIYTHYTFTLVNSSVLFLRPTLIEFNPLPLARLAGPKGSRYRLNAVEWEDGSRAVLDSRGLLHLSSSNTHIPNLTLILPKELPVSAWTDRDERFGTSLFFTQDVNSAPQRLLDYLSLFVKGLPNQLVL